MKKSVLIVGESFLPDNTPRANRWHFFSTELMRRDWAVRVMSRNLFGESIGIDCAIGDITRGKSFLLSRAVSKLFSLLIFEKEILWAICCMANVIRRREEFSDVALIVGYGLPFSGAVLAMAVSRLLSTPCIVEYGDPIDVNPARRATFLERLVNKWILLSADVIIVTNAAYAAYVEKEYSRPAACLPPVASIPPSVSRETFKHVMKELHKYSASATLFYAGHFYKDIRSGEEFLAALSRSKMSVEFVHAGMRHRSADDHDRYRNIGYIDKYSVLYHLYCADLALYFANQSNYQTPSKVVEVGHMATVVLAIGDDFNESERELLGNTGHVFFVQNSIKEISAALKAAVRVGSGIKKTFDGFCEKLNSMRDYNDEVFKSLENICEGQLMNITQSDRVG